MSTVRLMLALTALSVALILGDQLGAIELPDIGHRLSTEANIALFVGGFALGLFAGYLLLRRRDTSP